LRREREPPSGPRLSSVYPTWPDNPEIARRLDTCPSNRLPCGRWNP